MCTVGKENNTPYLRHDVAKIYGVTPQFLSSKSEIQKTLRHISEGLGLHVVNEFYHQFDSAGWSAVFVLSESHLALHTWPEFEYAHLDMVTCSKGAHLDKLSSLVKRFFSTDEVFTKQLIY